VQAPGMFVQAPGNFVQGAGMFEQDMGNFKRGAGMVVRDAGTFEQSTGNFGRVAYVLPGCTFRLLGAVWYGCVTKNKYSAPRDWVGACIVMNQDSMSAGRDVLGNVAKLNFWILKGVYWWARRQ
jgi:hypothetical protein